MPHILNVRLGSRRVGTITNLASDHNVFTFDPEYLDDSDAPILSLGFLNSERRVINPTKTPQVRLLPFFANLLPEGHLRTYLAAHARVNPLRDFPLLWLAGSDLPGAVVIEHPDGLNVPPDDENVVPKDVQEDPSVLKFSLAGVQLKFSAIRETDGGLTIPLHGVNGDWIMKMPSGTYRNVPENEFSMLALARNVGIDVPEMRLGDPTEVGNLPPEVRSDLGRALFIKRFDRKDGNRIHIEDFNQIFNQYPLDKYKNASYGNMLTGVWEALGAEQAAEFIRRLVFNVLIGNGDMHLKNWSVIYSDGRTPKLAPAYDYVATRAYIPADRLGLTIAGSREWSDVSYDNLERFARKARVPSGLVTQSARDMVERVKEAWPKLRASLPIPKDLADQIDTHMQTVPIFGRVRATSSPFKTTAPVSESAQQPEIE